MSDVDSIRLAAREVVSQLAGTRVADDEALVSSGLIDSLSILNLISKIEGKLGIRLKTSGLQPDDFDSIDLIAETVLRAKA
jgi:acyl carrier protein